MGSEVMELPQQTEMDWKCEFENIKRQRKDLQIFYLIRLLNQSGLNLGKHVFQKYAKDEFICQFENMNQLLESIMAKLDGIDIENHIIEMEDRSKSIFSDIIDLCKKNRYSSERFKRIEAVFEQVTLSKGVRKDANEITYEELVSHFEECELVPQNFITKYVYSFIRISKDKINNIFSRGEIRTDEQPILQLYNCSCKMMSLPFNEYEYISYYIDIMKMHNILGIMLGEEKDIILTETQMLALALEICGISVIIKIYLNTAMQYVMLFLMKGEEKYFKKAEHKMNIAEKCIDGASNYELLERLEKTRIIFSEIKSKGDCAKLVELL